MAVALFPAIRVAVILLAIQGGRIRITNRWGAITQIVFSLSILTMGVSTVGFGALLIATFWFHAFPSGIPLALGLNSVVVAQVVSEGLVAICVERTK